MKKKDSYAKTDFILKTELTRTRLSKLKERTPPCETD
jgi:hypothetical protein